MVEIVFGLILLLNGLILLANCFELLPLHLSHLNTFGLDSIFSKAPQEWRSLIECIHSLVASHITAFVLICMGTVILAAGMHTKKSLQR
jgi:hypothetical protein